MYVLEKKEMEIDARDNVLPRSYSVTLYIYFELTLHEYSKTKIKGTKLLLWWNVFH